jgi:hypothetical protein
MSKSVPLKKKDITDSSNRLQNEDKKINLPSGRSISVKINSEEELEIFSPDGKIELKIRFTEEGPTLSLECGRLDLKATENISLKAKKVEIRADEETLLESGGKLKIDSEKQMDIRSTENVKVVGKLIYLN